MICRHKGRSIPSNCCWARHTSQSSYMHQRAASESPSMTLKTHRAWSKRRASSDSVHSDRWNVAIPAYITCKILSHKSPRGVHEGAGVLYRRVSTLSLFHVPLIVSHLPYITPLAAPKYALCAASSTPCVAKFLEPRSLESRFPRRRQIAGGSSSMRLGKLEHVYLYRALLPTTPHERLEPRPEHGAKTYGAG